jgi:class 3 adenylate cyclase/ligand-binding sensor domain-containing protein/predicted metal-dependent HD superfamily phosphohydrolase
MKHILLLGVIIILGSVCWSQSNIRFQNYSINSGLSQSYVADILQDESGFIWICTQDGLNKFDGYQFRIFSADRTNGIESNYFNCGIKASNGILWFGTQQGLIAYNPKNERFESFIPGANFSDKSIRSIVENEKGNLYVLFSTKGVYEFTISKQEFAPVSKELTDKSFNRLAYFPSEGLFVATPDNGVLVHKPGSLREINPFEKSSEAVDIKAIVQFIAGKYLIASSNNLFIWNAVSNQIEKFDVDFENRFPGSEIEDVQVLENGIILVATVSSGLIELKPSSQDEPYAIYHYRQDIFQKNTLLNDQTTRLFIDRDGQLWLGTQRGFGTFNPNYLGFLGVGPSGNLEQGLPTPSVWGFAEDEMNNSIYIGTSNGISRIDTKKNIFNHFYRESQSNLIRKVDMPALSIFPVNSKEVLVGCLDGLHKLVIDEIDPTNYSYTSIPHEKNVSLDYGRVVYQIIRLDDTKYWLATRGGICIYDSEKNKFIYPEKSVGSVKYMFKDSFGKLWIAPANGGIYKAEFDTENNIKLSPASFNNHLSQIIKGNVNVIHQTSPNVFWLGTYGDGLIKVHVTNNQIEQFDVSKGLPNNVIYGILEDEQDNLWLSTNRGLSKFNKKKESFTNYSEVDGLMSNEFNIGAFMKAANGELYFGGIFGYNHFLPSELQEGRQNLSVFLTELQLSNTKILPGQDNNILQTSIAFTNEITLSHRQRNISIQFASNDLANASLVEYRYFLEGNDDDYTFLGAENNIILNALSPGIYHLKIYAKSVYGEWSNRPTVLTIIVEPPFWMTWWFRVLVIVAIVIALFVFYRVRLEKQRRRMVRLEMKIVERTSEIRAQSKKIEDQKKKIELQKKEVEEKKLLLEQEKEKVEQLLHNMLPEETARELRDVGSTKARGYNRVSVMFTDFVGFTKIAATMKPIDLLDRLDFFFSKFDEIIEKWNLEKIKTVGDAYLCAGGMPIRTKENPIQTVLAGLEIQQFMRNQPLELDGKKVEPWHLRIGINTGEVVAGVVGKKRYAYDIWGATVNLAQRMETNSKSGRVNISESTYEAIQPYFECTLRGEIMTKNSGLVNMYFVDRIKPELSADEEGMVPNERFWKIVDLHLYSSINYQKAERTIHHLLEEKLSPKLYYHSIWHTKDVTAAVERLALMEGITDEDLFLLKSAASYHDAGFMERYEKNEPIGVRLAEEHLPNHGYSESQIKTIKELIYVTQIPHKPQNKLQEIICDADLDYLGRDDFHEIADKLRRELREHGKIDSDRKWDEMQVAFLTQHKYFTESAIKMRREKKLKHLEEIKARLERNQYAD